jgi:hypothetical protein
VRPAYAVAKETEEGWVFLAEPFWRPRWTRHLTGAQLWISPEKAEAAIVTREAGDAVVVPVVALQPE